MTNDPTAASAHDGLAFFTDYLQRWQLTPDGAPIATSTSKLLPVRMNGRAAMLKVTDNEDERSAARLLDWWDGCGAARLYAHDDRAVVIECAEGERSLLAMALDGDDDEASRILCAAVAQLHAPRARPAPQLVPLDRWFGSLFAVADAHGGVMRRSAATARELLAEPRDVVPLHGDIHHENVLDFGPRGWLAIDPKRVVGERGFDYANILVNPDLETVAQPQRFLRQVDVVSEASGLERRRLLQWILAFAGLSAAWFFEDGQPADTDFAVAGMAAAALDQA